MWNMSVSTVPTDLKGSKNHTQTSLGVNWHHPTELADCNIHSEDLRAANMGDTTHNLQILDILSWA